MPAKPTETPTIFKRLIFSFLIKIWASNVEVKGEVDIRIAAKLLCTCLTPYAIRKKGNTKFTNPIEANQAQSFENASIFIFLILHKISKGIEPKKTLIKAMVIGPKDSVAIFILKNAEAQITAKKTSKE